MSDSRDEVEGFPRVAVVEQLIGQRHDVGAQLLDPSGSKRPVDQSTKTTVIGWVVVRQSAADVGEGVAFPEGATQPVDQSVTTGAKRWVAQDSGHIVIASQNDATLGRSVHGVGIAQASHRSVRTYTKRWIKRIPQPRCH